MNYLTSSLNPISNQISGKSKKSGHSQSFVEWAYYIIQNMLNASMANLNIR